MKHWFTLRMVLILGTVTLALGGTVAYWETRRFVEAEYSTFTYQSIQLASVFARSANVWLIRSNDGALEFAANLMLAGSGQYVRIIVGSITILDEGIGGPDIELLDLSFGSASSEGELTRGTLRRGGVDVVVPISLPSQGSDGDIVGAVQIGFSDAQAREKVRGHRILVSGLTAGSWLIFMLAAVFVTRIVRMKSQLSAAETPESQAHAVISCGALTINTRTYAVRLSEIEIELTPKTFELLTFLARNEGKTFSDADLLAALWADAPYAASGDVKQCIYMLRRRLSIAGADPKRIIVNVKGFGYRLEAPTEAILRSD